MNAKKSNPSKKKTKTRAEIVAEKKKLQAINDAYYERDWDAQRYCNKHGFTVYAAMQKSGRLKIFSQVGEKFKPVSDREYDQEELKDIKQMAYDMDQKYKVVERRIFKDKGYE